MSVRHLFDPEGVAVVGASRSAGKLGYEAMGNVAPFDGPVYPVNPNGEGDLFGEPFVGSMDEIDGPVDLALLCVPAPVAPEVLEECGEAGVGAAIVYAGGFAEADDRGAALQADLIDVADAYDVALLGPNTSGLLVPRRGLYASFVPNVGRVEPGSVAVVAQSGGVAHALAFQTLREGRGLSAMVGLGNRANTDFAPVVESLDGDPATEAVALHVEGTDDARGLLETCRAIDTPVVALDVGRADVGGFAASHTGALTGEYDLYEAGFEQFGVPTVDSTTELLDAAHALATAPAPKARNGGDDRGTDDGADPSVGVGVVTAQAGPGIIVADRLKTAGAAIPDLDPETDKAVAERLPGITYAENPVDTGRPSETFGEVVELVATDDNVDLVVVYELYEPSVDLPTETLSALAEAGTPAVFATDGPEEDDADDGGLGGVSGVLSDLTDAGVAAYRTPERGADAAVALVEYAKRNAGGRRGANAGATDAGEGAKTDE